MAFASSQRHLTNGLPSHSFGNPEKHHRHSAPWTKPVSLAIPGVHTRRLRILVPNTGKLSRLGAGRLGRRRGPLLMCFIALSIFGVYFIVSRRYEGREWMEQWPSQSGDPSTLVFQRQDLQRIWKWEIASGHYPSRASIPKHIGLKQPPHNPAIPPKLRVVPPSRYRPPTTAVAADTDIDTLGTGPKRVYLDIQSKPPDVAYPPRPVPNSIADMDVVMKHCDFSTGKYVRDCLEVLRLGGGLDNGRRVRRGQMDDWKYIFLEQEGPVAQLAEDLDQQPIPIARPASPNVQRERDPNAGLNKKPNSEWESSIALQAVVPSSSPAAKNDACDPNNPRVFHMFWTGPFTDKPYLALMSYLFSQNTGIHLLANETGHSVCRPQFWLWINPGPAASVPNPSAVHDMYEQLKTSPWAAPFLHPRFKDIIQFKLWNTTEQLDGVPELKDEWRALSGSLFNSGGQVISVPEEKIKAVESGAGGNSTSTKEDDILNRTGSKSLSSYDRLSVILSDMARFVLCHRFGGIYLDADTIFLRDWEELWGWKGAFAYRWSRLENYNTAVLRMNKNSALGTFLFRTALKNGLDFHPMTVTKYMADAHLEGLLLRLPDALFDSAWLNTEYFQRERPPQPYFTEFADLFDTPPQNSAAPQALGFEGFFRGAYSYHFHNFWWKPFDPSRNWPDLGPRFIAGERAARHALSASSPPSPADAGGAEADKEDEDSVTDDKRDLDWSAVLKRTFESYIRGERPNMYGEWIHW
ncbi:hypothetical protein BDN71DRAFT_1449005 [Pleurotus eryngii]|uniref:Glycosyltransferase family 32 protein n=1 Tax=Pleurotus eryngii TaxID=5323 RepID=A0A9P6D670_PLEER|nr:hypothetical protein BDN71DRAFT_1449005 [Pleurotus eryngii]